MSTATLHIENTKALVPVLRFQEFEGNWEEKTLFDISKEVSYGMNAAAKTFDGIHKYIRITDIDSESRKFIPNPLTSPEGDIDEKFKLKVNDLLFTRTGASVGKSYLYDSKDGALYYAGFLIKFNIAKADSYFVYSLTLKESYDKWVQVNSMRSGQPGLNAEEYKGLKLNIPTLPEQQKIASFLSVVDEKIRQLSRKNELLEQYKKGVMQQLFSGKLRFKDENGKDYSDWEEKILGDFVLSHKGGAPLTPSDFTKEPGCEVIPKKGITIGGRLVIDDETPTYCKPDFYEAYSKSIIDNSYIITTLRDLVPSGPSIGYMVQFKSKNKYILAQGVYGLKIDENKLNREWIIQFSNTIEYRKIMQTIMVGSTQVHIRNEEFFKVELNLPSIKEQQKIAKFLSSIDAKIESTSQQINQTQSFKKGLLQQMFV